MSEKQDTNQHICCQKRKKADPITLGPAQFIPFALCFLSPVP